MIVSTSCPLVRGMETDAKLSGGVLYSLRCGILMWGSSLQSANACQVSWQSTLVRVRVMTESHRQVSLMLSTRHEISLSRRN